MVYDVILSRKDSGYLAKIKEWPEIWASEKTRDKAIKQVKAKLSEYLIKQQIEVVQIEVPSANNPWLDKFGWFKDDPTFDDLQAEIAAYRRAVVQNLPSRVLGLHEGQGWISEDFDELLPDEFWLGT